MTEKLNKSDEVQKNFEAFEKLLPDLVEEHSGKYALIRHQKIVAIYSTVEDAVQTGQSFYDDGLFSVQKITSTPIDLGFFSHAVRFR